MIDLHSHVLFDIDDGAKSIEASLEILKKAERIGIKKVMATPHFTVGGDVDEFIAARDQRLEELREAVAREGINVEIKAGAEVYITDDLFDEESLDKLTLGDSKFILAEFKYHGVKPERFLEYIDCINDCGLKVLVAHVERYSYVRKNPILLSALDSRDALLQVNAISLFEEGEEGDFAYMLFKNRLIYAVGSDIHHAHSRRYGAMEKLGAMDEKYVRKILWDNPMKIFGE